MKINTNKNKLSEIIIDTLSQHKGIKINQIDLKGKSSIADYMIICSGTSNRHIISLSNYLYDRLKKLNLKTLNVEGKKGGDWIVLDAGDIIIHLFREEVREYYSLEKMWNETLSDVLNLNN